jgi:hypothetical protein
MAFASSCLVEVPIGAKSCDAEHACVEGFACVEERCVDVNELTSCLVDTDCGEGQRCAAIGRCIPVPDDDDDAGAPADAGVEVDGGVTVDSGIDAGEVDAGGAVDAGPDEDAGNALDAGTELDAGFDFDAGDCANTDALRAWWPLDAPAGRRITSGSTELVAAWSFEQNLNDGASGHDGNGVSVSFAAGIVGNAVSGPVSIPADEAFKPTTAFTFAAWVRADSTGPRGLFSTADSPSTGEGWHISISAGNQILVHADQMGSNDLDMNGPVLTLGRWHHLLLDWDGSMARIFLDGVVRTTSVWEGAAEYDTSGEPMTIGGSADLPDWDGAVDEAAFWSRVLEADEMADLYGAGVVEDVVAGADGRNFGGRSQGGRVDASLAFIESGLFAELGEGPPQIDAAFTLSLFFRPNDDWTDGLVSSRALVGSYEDLNNHLWVGYVGADYPKNTVPRGAIVVKTKADGSGTYRWIEPRSLSSGEWHHLAVSFDPARDPRVSVYFDGAVEPLAGTDGADDEAFSLSGTNAPLRLGTATAYSSGTAVQAGLGGRVDEVILFDDALHPNAVSRLALGLGVCGFAP